MNHAGDLTPEETYQLLESEPGAVLVDVRTRPEWNFVGLPDLTALGRQVILIEWNAFPDGARNPHFVDELRAAGVSEETPIAFICRSGQRSADAAVAATAAGFERAHNVAQGFEGDLDSQGHRTSVGGWKLAGLPWRQT